MSSIRRISVLLTGLLCLCGCGDAPGEPPITPERHTTTIREDNEFAVYDPAENTNKHIYKFNAKFDKYVFLPVVHAYTLITPEFVRTGVTNFFFNIGEVNNFINSVLQLSPRKADITLIRFAVNSTIGLAGTFDVATRLGLQRQQEDFGKTLGHWGAGSGAYIMLPVLGPSNVRDTIGQVFDYGTFAIIVPEPVQNNIPYEMVDYGLQPVDIRYRNSFRYYSSGSPFEYEIVRYIYTELRTAQIEKEKKE